MYNEFCPCEQCYDFDRYDRRDDHCKECRQENIEEFEELGIEE